MATKTVNIDAEIHKALKLEAAKKGVPLSTLVECAVKQAMRTDKWK